MQLLTIFESNVLDDKLSLPGAILKPIPFVRFEEPYRTPDETGGKMDYYDRYANIIKSPIIVFKTGQDIMYVLIPFNSLTNGILPEKIQIRFIILGLDLNIPMTINNS